MDDLRYGCNFDWQSDRHLPERDPSRSILLPENNLLCGLRIVEDQLVKRHEPLLSDKSYWSTLRPDNQSFAVFEKQMVNVPAYCELHPKSREPIEASPAPLVEATSQPPKKDQDQGTDDAQSPSEWASAKR
ncbi:hypothetical protein SBA5_250017 [Candidatus Sulfotelmatomonas gaucii]|uniref:Uncharacterized protein n=1 Tax=Candidatus Sulfuritelmatomonas gaucii TaxID=2043161 RepID=A0A2N9L917_9BACT|nr:hypothetical protein SBA5_250017 [Candidatus Sulfotelmatomonas gaucii]